MEIEKPKISLPDQPTINCENCDSIYFREVIYIKKVSKILTGTGEDTIVPFPIYKCDNCGHVNKDFNPFEEKEKTIIND
jgi:uncharacterized Zn finger protein